MAEVGINTTSKRIEWLDIAKAVAIMGTIGGHTFTQQTLLVCLSYTCFAMFWIISGYTIKPCNGVRGLLNRTLADFKKMIIPAFLVCLLSGVLATLSGEYRDWNALINNLKQSVTFFVSSNPGMLWFFWALFWAKLLYRIMLKLGNFRYIPMIILLVLSLVYSPMHRFPVLLDVSPVGMLFLEMGHLLKVCDRKIANVSKVKQLLIEGGVLVLALLGTYYLTWTRRLYIDLAGRDYTLQALLQCVCLMLLVLFVCKIISLTPASDFISEVGQHTFGILLLHFLDGYWLSPIVEILFDATGFSNVFLYFGIRVVLLLIVTFVFVKLQDRFFYYINYGKH